MTWNYLQDVDVGVRQLRMYGVVSWLNAAERVSRSRRLTPLLAVFVFRSCVVVVVAHELTRDKKKSKVTVSNGKVTVSLSVIRTATAVRTYC